jgi:hypothetical protein
VDEDLKFHAEALSMLKNNFNKTLRTPRLVSCHAREFRNGVQLPL